jgi:hypothetical protein
MSVWFRIKETSLKYRTFIVLKKKFSVKEDRIFVEAGVFRHSHARSKDVADQSAHKKSTTKQ